VGGELLESFLVTSDITAELDGARNGEKKNNGRSDGPKNCDRQYSVSNYQYPPLEAANSKSI